MLKRVWAFVMGLGVLLLASPASASFHLMKIEQAMGGINGDTSQQVVQLRMRAGGQNLVGTAQARLIARDAAGLNPVTLIIFPTDVSNAALGARILVVSPAFAAAHPTITPDFTMTSVIPAGYLAAGRLTFEAGGVIYWSLAWGGAGYTGSNTGTTDNDPNGNFGPPFAGALPSTTTQALRFSAADPTGSAASTTNAADYSVTAGAAVVTNNADDSFTVTDVPMADLSITKTDGRTTAAPLDSITYTIVATNAGPDPVTDATVVDNPPASLTGVTWTCVGASGGTCSGAGAATINDTVDLPVGATVTYTLNGTVSANPSSLRNTATVNVLVGAADPNLDNNSATDSDVLVCFGETVVVPDGRVTASTIGALTTQWFAASLSIGNSYSVEFKNTSGESVPPGILTMFSGDDGCSLLSTMTPRDTTGIDPGASPSSQRVSFTASGIETFFRARLDNTPGASVIFSFTWSDTTMLSPAWTTNGAFNTFYSFQNTTGFTLNGTVTLFDTAGTVVSTANLVIAPGQTASTNTAALGTDRNHTGTARFTHDGPPGAIVAEAANANFSISPAYVQPVKFQAVREATH